ncbi:MAG: hypothetical protein QW589_03640 [Candidatus Bathyarchaeia archaeon]
MSEATLEAVYKEVKDLKMLIDALAETIDVISNPKELEGIRKGLMDIKKGRVRNWSELARIKKDGKI